MAVGRTDEAVEPYVRRRRTRALLVGASLGGLVGAVLLAAALVAGRSLGVSGVAVGIGLCAAAVVVGAGFALRRTPDAVDLLVRLDADLRLKARVRTAWQVEHEGNGGAVAEALVQDALGHLTAHTASEWTPRVVPRLAWVAMAAVALACTPLLLPSPPGTAPSLTQAERQAIESAAGTLAAEQRAEALTEPLQRLRAAETVEEALAALADAESRLEPVASQHGEAAADVSALADAVQAAAPDLPSDLVGELRALRERLAGRQDAAALASALEGVESRVVSAETLARIVAEMRDLAASDSDAVAALEQVRAQKKAIAAAALESTGAGRVARLDGRPGRESDESVAQGARLGGPVESGGQPGTLVLDAIASEMGRGRRVYSRDPSNAEPSSGTLLPFEQVVLAAQESAAQAVRNESLPIAYRDRIRRYFVLLAAAAQRGPK